MIMHLCTWTLAPTTIIYINCILYGPRKLAIDTDKQLFLVDLSILDLTQYGDWSVHNREGSRSY